AGALNPTITSSLTTNWLFTARPRLGLAANNWLIYATGGLAVVQMKGHWTYADTLNPGVTVASIDASTTKAGWVGGAGVETVLPGNWILGGEYLYLSLGSITGTGNISPFTDVILTHTVDLKSNILRARLSKKF